MKVLGTNVFLYGDILEKIKKLGYTGSHRQFRLVCKCRGIADANRKCKDIGFNRNVFEKGWYSETGNLEELSLCEKEDIWITIDGTSNKKGYVSAKDLFGL